MTSESAAMAINPQAASLFSNYDNVALADALGDLEVVIKAAQARQKAAREEMVRRKLHSLDGARFFVTRSVGNEKRFDSEAVKATMGLDWYAQFQKSGNRTTYTVTAKAPAQLGLPA